MKKVIIISAVALLTLGVLAVIFLSNTEKEADVSKNDQAGVTEGGATFTGLPMEKTELSITPAVQEKIDAALLQAPSISENIYQIDKYPYSDAPSFVPEYTIDYSKTEQRFLINLYEYPLLETRVKASQALINKLNITDEDACKLNVDVTVNSSVNRRLAGQNLGLSFCPDRIDLSNVVDDRVSNEE